MIDYYKRIEEPKETTKKPFQNLNTYKFLFKKLILSSIALLCLYSCGTNNVNEINPRYHSESEDKNMPEDLKEYDINGYGNEYLKKQEQNDREMKLMMLDPLLHDIEKVGDKYKTLYGIYDKNEIVCITRNIALNVEQTDILAANILTAEEKLEKIREELDGITVFNGRAVSVAYYDDYGGKYKNLSMFLNQDMVNAIYENNPTKLSVETNPKTILEQIKNVTSHLTLLVSCHGSENALYFRNLEDPKDDKSITLSELFLAYQTSIINRKNTDFHKISNKDIYIIDACYSTNFALDFLKLCDACGIPKPIFICSTEYNLQGHSWYVPTVNTNPLMHVLFGGIGDNKNNIRIGDIIREDGRKFHIITIITGEEDGIIQVSRLINYINLQTPLPIDGFA